MHIKVIVAHDKERGISRVGKIPWNIKQDKELFHSITTYTVDPKKQNVVIMGKMTFFDCKVLPNRINLILTSSFKVLNEQLCFSKLQEALAWCAQNSSKIESIFIIGGKQLYDYVLTNHLYDELYLTEIEGNHWCDNNLNYFDIKIPKIFTYQFSKEVKFSKYSVLRENVEERKYLDLIYNIHQEGEIKETRNGLTKSVFSRQLVFNLHTLPLLTTKKMFLRGIFEELMFFLNGETNTKKLEEKDINIWKLNTSKQFLSDKKLNYNEGEMGPMYGFIWNYFGTKYEGGDKKYDSGFNQIDYVIDLLNTDPNSRRIMMTTFDPEKANKESVLYPCHGIVTQFYVRDKKYLDAKVYIRSSDVFLGLPFNITSYAILVKLLCSCEEIKKQYLPGKLYIDLGDTHIYEEHIQSTITQLLRQPNQFPNLKLKTKKKLRDYTYDDIELLQYHSHDSIKAILK